VFRPLVTRWKQLQDEERQAIASADILQICSAATLRFSRTVAEMFQKQGLSAILFRAEETELMGESIRAQRFAEELS
jgi:hypothetical protein